MRITLGPLKIIKLSDRELLISQRRLRIILKEKISYLQRSQFKKQIQVAGKIGKVRSIS
jgi:hypothetical protein